MFIISQKSYCTNLRLTKQGHKYFVDKHSIATKTLD